MLHQICWSSSMRPKNSRSFEGVPRTQKNFMAQAPSVSACPQKKLIGTARTFSNALCYANPWRWWNSFTRPGKAKFYVIPSMSHWKKGDCLCWAKLQNDLRLKQTLHTRRFFEVYLEAVTSVTSIASVPSVTSRLCSFCSFDFCSLGSSPCCTHILDTRSCCIPPAGKPK